MKRALLAACLALGLLAGGTVPVLAHTVPIHDPENRPEGVGPAVRRSVGNPQLLGGPDTRPAHLITDGAGFEIQVFAAAIGHPNE